MKTMTSREASEIESDAIKCFKTEFAKLCKEYDVHAVCVGTRKEKGGFSDEKEATLCAAFAMAELSDPTIREAKAIKTAYEKAEETVAKIIVSAIFSEIEKECDCDDCKKEAERIKGIKYSMDGTKVCATFADFVNLQESPAGFGDTADEAKADLLKNAAPKF